MDCGAVAVNARAYAQRTGPDQCPALGACGLGAMRVLEEVVAPGWQACCNGAPSWRALDSKTVHCSEHRRCPVARTLDKSSLPHPARPI